MADPAPTERPMPVGYGFRPNDRELVGHYLHRKLMADDPSIHDTIPEIGVCKYEPRDLLAWAASAASATKFDDFQCYFFSPRDYKYCNGKQFNRTTSRGFWKVTGRDRRITDRDTNNVIGTKKTLVFYEGRLPNARKTRWVIHEYHDAQLPPQQRTHVLCWLRRNDEQKRKEKIHPINGVERESLLQNENPANTCMNLEEQCCFDTKSTIQPASQLIKATDSIIQPASQLNKATDSMIQSSSQLIEATDSMIQLAFQLIEDSMIQSAPQLIEDPDSMIQPPSQLIKGTDLMIQPLSQLSKAKDSTIQTTFQVDEANIQSPSQAAESMNSMIHTPAEPNYAVEAAFDGEFYFSPGEFDDLDSLWKLPPAPSMDEQGPFKNMATSYMHCHEA